MKIVLVIGVVVSSGLRVWNSSYGIVRPMRSRCS